MFSQKKPSAKLIQFCLLLAVFLTASIFGVWHWLFNDLPALDRLPERLNTPSIRFTDRTGSLLYEALPSEGGRNRPVSLDVVPLHLQQATIATEDSNFYHHPGVDVIGIVRAFWINLRGGETLAGGSTITQQVARNLLLEPDERFQRTIRRKLRESWLAWRLARLYSKDEILSLYINQSYFGSLAYGVEAAAQTYFGVAAADLDLAESALLAGLPQAPAIYDPLNNPSAAKERQLVVLALMEKEGYITPQERLLAEGEPLIYTASPYPLEAPHFVLWVRAQIDDLLAPEELAQPLTVRTSLDLDWQHHAERAITQQIAELQRQQGGLGHNVNNAALVALDPHTGEILAMVGSPDYFDPQHSGAINMALTPRQPGSAIKPLIYAAAFDPAQPDPWTPATMILDVYRTFLTGDDEPYIPVNYDNREHGPVLARQALGSSLNIPAVSVLDTIGIGTLTALAADLGISTFGDPQSFDLSIALGGGEVSLLELTSAFGTFANGGTRVEPISILDIADSEGHLLYAADRRAPVQVLDERVTWLISDILSDNDARTLGFGAHSSLNIGRPAAVKTGTTSNFHDNWTVGYTPDLVTGIWVGNTSHEPMFGVTGLTGAAPIWHQFMRSVLSGQPESAFARPEGLVNVEVCALSGFLPTELCPYRHLEWFIEGTQPTAFDTIYQEVSIDTLTGFLADENTPTERQRLLTAFDLPPEAHPWARDQGLTLLADLSTSQASGAIAYALQIISPAPNSVYFLSARLPVDSQSLHIEAVSSVGVTQVSLWVDDELVETLAGPPYETWWVLQEGQHQVWAEASNGDGDKLISTPIHFEVKKGEK